MTWDGRTRLSAEANAVALDGAPLPPLGNSHRKPGKPSRPAERIAEALTGRPSGKGWMARCPAHHDTTPSLSINETSEGKVLVKCFEVAHRRMSSRPCVVAASGMASALQSKRRLSSRRMILAGSRTRTNVAT